MARAAGDGPGDDHPVAFLEVFHFAAHSHHLSHALVAERKRPRIRARAKHIGNGRVQTVDHNAELQQGRCAVEQWQAVTVASRSNERAD
jgi:hypothetical protein